MIWYDIAEVDDHYWRAWYKQRNITIKNIAEGGRQRYKKTPKGNTLQVTSKQFPLVYGY